MQGEADRPSLDPVEKGFDPLLGIFNLPGNDIDPNFADVLAHIIPSRTRALGHTPDIEGFGNIQLFNFRASNYDHSGQYHGFLADGTRNRAGYWENILNQSLGLQAEELKLGQ